MAYTIKSYDDIVKDMIAWVVSNTPSITDLTPGSVIRSYCESAGLCIEELYVSVYLGFRRYLDQIQENVFSFDRKAGTKANASVIFTRTVVSAAVITIPIGTLVKTNSGLVFKTTAVGVIPTLQASSSAVAVEAADVGIAYNVQANTIIVMGSTIDGVDTVTNANAATGGVDKETDYQYKKRFQAYIEGLGRSNVAGLIAGALSSEGITSASVQELFPPVANVNVRLYVDDGSLSGVSSAQVAEIQAIIDGDGTELNPGYRAAGVNVVVYAPAVVSQDITMTVNVLEGVDTDQIVTDINQQLTNYVNNLGVGATIIRSELVSAVMRVYGVTDCNISVPSGNVTIASSQVGRVGTITAVVL
jgi:uncharacterized phage protein gp47/JayE